MGEASSVGLIWSLGLRTSSDRTGGLPRLLAPRPWPPAGRDAGHLPLEALLGACFKLGTGLSKLRQPFPRPAPTPPGSTCRPQYQPDPRLLPAPRSSARAGIGVDLGAVQRQSRERATCDWVAFRFIRSSRRRHHHDTIATFRRRFLEGIDGYLYRCLAYPAPRNR
jgi:hypothetical protein